VMPLVRHTSATSQPASPYSRVATICSSLKLLLFIRPPRERRTHIPGGADPLGQVGCVHHVGEDALSRGRRFSGFPSHAFTCTYRCNGLSHLGDRRVAATAEFENISRTITRALRAAGVAGSLNLLGKNGGAARI
jgi:hypothetical protein